MKTTPLSEVIALKDRSSVVALSGTVTAVKERYTGGGSVPWASQQVKIEEDGASIMVKIWNRTEFGQDVIGKILTVKAGASKLVWKEETVPGDKTAVKVLVVSVSDKSEINFTKEADEIPGAESPKAKVEESTSVASTEKAKTTTSTGMRCLQVTYEKSTRQAEFENVKVGVIVEINPGVSAQHAIDMAKKFVMENSPKSINKNSPF